MNTFHINTTRQQVLACVFALVMTTGMLMGVGQLAAPQADDALMAAAPAASAAAQKS